MKVLLARKYLSKNPFTKYLQKNIIERWAVYVEDFQKMKAVKEKFEKDGYSVRIYEIVEEKNDL